MITQFKIFENESLPQIGDYVMVDPNCVGNNLRLSDFYESAIGKLTHIDIEQNLWYVTFENVPPKLNVHILKKQPFRRRNIIVWGKTEEEVEMKKQANKYNL